MQNLSKNFISKDSLDKARLTKLIAKFPTANIMVVGDLILDEYLLANPERISREAPVLILNYQKSNFVMGGSANAAANAASLSAGVTLIGLTGDDMAAAELANIASHNGVNLQAIPDTERLTTVKTRVVSTATANPETGTVLQQQVLRIDKQTKLQASDELQEKIFEKVAAAIESTDLILLSDYNNGVFSEKLCQKIISLAAANDTKVVVDSIADFKKFKGAYSLTPNQPDLESTLKLEITNDDELIKAGIQVSEELNAPEVLITRGAKGMMLVSQQEDSYQINELPAFNLVEVFDVSGAGDTVAATYCLALAAGANTSEAATLGNLAASLVVRKSGTACTDTKELLELIESL